jgi:hypothetical protein
VEVPVLWRLPLLAPLSRYTARRRTSEVGDLSQANCATSTHSFCQSTRTGTQTRDDLGMPPPETRGTEMRQVIGFELKLLTIIRSPVD